MRRLTFLVVIAFALSVAAAEAAKPSTTGKPTTTKAPTTKGPSAKGAAPKTTTVRGPAAKGSSAKAKGVQTKTTKASGTSAKTTKADKQLARADAKAAKSDAKLARTEQKSKKGTSDRLSNTSTSGTTSTTTTVPGTIDYTATSLGQKLQKNSVQRSKIEAKLAAAGYTGTVYEAAYGFKNFGQLNAATNMVQNQGTSFELLKVLMTGTYVDPETHVLYRAQRQPDGTVKLVSPDLATNPVSTLSLGQSKQAIAGGAVMPEIVPVTTTTQTTKTF